MSSSFIYVVARDKIVCIYYILFIYSFISGHLGCFHLLSIVNYTARNMAYFLNACHNDCVYICTCLRKVMTNLDSILKSRDITLSTKVHVVKAMVFPVVMYVRVVCM